MSAQISYRLLEANDGDFHREITYVALWDPPEDERRPRSALDHPMVREYYEAWGKPDDLGFVALAENRPVGAVWCRVKSSLTAAYRHYPELGIGIMEGYQGQGIGTQLFNRLIEALPERHHGLRLGVHPKNVYAIMLYERFGFRFYAQPADHYPQMVWERFPNENSVSPLKLGSRFNQHS